MTLIDGGDLDTVGRVIDFSVIKTELCAWLDSNWDHCFLIWESDPFVDELISIDQTAVVLPFNPTAENLALHLLHEIGPQLLAPHGVLLFAVRVEETRKCSADASLDTNKET